jgi:hypothetical protein
VWCYANANLTRRDQAGEAMRFVEFWHPNHRHRSRVALLRFQGHSLRRTFEIEPTRHLVYHHSAARRSYAVCNRCPPANGTRL